MGIQRWVGISVRAQVWAERRRWIQFEWRVRNSSLFDRGSWAGPHWSRLPSTGLLAIQPQNLMWSWCFYRIWVKLWDRCNYSVRNGFSFHNHHIQRLGQSLIHLLLDFPQYFYPHWFELHVNHIHKSRGIWWKVPHHKPSLHLLCVTFFPVITTSSRQFT